MFKKYPTFEHRRNLISLNFSVDEEDFELRKKRHLGRKGKGP